MTDEAATGAEADFAAPPRLLTVLLAPGQVWRGQDGEVREITAVKDAVANTATSVAVPGIVRYRMPSDMRGQRTTQMAMRAWIARTGATLAGDNPRDD